MKTVARGTCPLDCPDTCRWVLEVEDGRATSIRGDREHPFTAGALCGKVNNYLEAVYDPERLIYPMRRVGAKGEGRFERIGWDQAITAIADGFRRSIALGGPESILPYYYAGTEGAVQGWTLGPRLFRALGASRLGTTICTAPMSAALAATIGGPVGTDPEEAVDAKLIVIWGANLLTSNMHWWKYAQEARRRGARLVAIDPLRTDTAARCDEHIAPIPGTDAALALGLMRVIVDQGKLDEQWARAHTEGLDELLARLGEWPVERAAEVCGLDVATVLELGRSIANTRPTLLRVGLGLQRHGGAAAAVRAIVSIPALTGDWRYPAGGALTMTGGHFGGISTRRVVAPADLPQPPARTINMSRLGDALADQSKPINALFVFDANPAASNPRARAVLAGLAREDLFTVVVEQRQTDTVDWADIVLPATMQPEHLDLLTAYGHLYVSLNEPALEPPGECLPNTEIFRRLAAALGLEHPSLFESDEEIARSLLDCDSARAAGITFESLRETGYARVMRPGIAPFAHGGFPTASGKVRLLAPELAESGQDPLVGYVPSLEVADEGLAERFPFALISPASRFTLNSTFASLPWHARKLGEPEVHLHARDATARGIAAGDDVRVRNDRGSFVARAVISEQTRPGVAFSYKQQWHKRSPDGVNVNATTPERDSDLGEGPTFHDNRVEIERISA